jgi:hypothetical protein
MIVRVVKLHDVFASRQGRNGRKAYQPEFRNWDGRQEAQKAQNTGQDTGQESGFVSKKHRTCRVKEHFGCEPQLKSIFLCLLRILAANELRLLGLNLNSEMAVAKMLDDGALRCPRPRGAGVTKRAG